MNLSKSILYLLSICLMGCSNPSIVSKQSLDVNVVDLGDRSSSRGTTKISKIEDSAIGIGPELNDQNTLIRKNIASKSVWALVIGPGLNRVICSVVGVRVLYERGVKFSLFSGLGMGAIVAAYLSQEATPEVIEWKFHKFFQNTKDMKAHSEEWLTRVKKDLLRDFKNVKIQSTKKTLIIPIFNNREGKMVYFKRGSLYRKLLENLDLSRRKNSKFLSPLIKGKINFGSLRNIGAEKLVKINVLSKKISFKRSEDFLFGIFGKQSSIWGEKSTQYDYEYDLPLNDFPLDTTNDLPKHLRTSYLYLRENSIRIRDDYLNERKN